MRMSEIAAALNNVIHRTVADEHFSMQGMSISWRLEAADRSAHAKVMRTDRDHIVVALGAQIAPATESVRFALRDDWAERVGTLIAKHLVGP